MQPFLLGQRLALLYLLKLLNLEGGLFTGRFLELSLGETAPETLWIRVGDCKFVNIQVPFEDWASCLLIDSLYLFSGYVCWVEFPVEEQLSGGLLWPIRCCCSGLNTEPLCSFIDKFCNFHE